MVVTKKLSATLLCAGMLALIACAEGAEETDGMDPDTVATAEETATTDERYRAVVVPEGLTWEEASGRAEADGGHLVTITSEEENERVHGLIADNPEIWVNVDVGLVTDGEEEPLQVSMGPWIGLHQPSGSSEPDGGWTWVTGEPVTYTNWSRQPNSDDREPNDLGGVEDFGHFFGTGLDTRSSGWNDAANDPAADLPEAGVTFTGDVSNPRGYVVEFE